MQAHSALPYLWLSGSSVDHTMRYHSRKHALALCARSLIEHTCSLMAIEGTEHREHAAIAACSCNSHCTSIECTSIDEPQPHIRHLLCHTKSWSKHDLDYLLDFVQWLTNRSLYSTLAMPVLCSHKCSTSNSTCSVHSQKVTCTTNSTTTHNCQHFCMNTIWQTSSMSPAWSRPPMECVNVLLKLLLHAAGLP